MLRENPISETHEGGKYRDAHEGGGPTRSSAEVSVMEMERRGWIIQLHSFGQPEMGGVFRMWQSWQLSASS